MLHAVVLITAVEKLSAVLGVLSGVSQTVLFGNYQQASVRKTREGWTSIESLVL